MTEAVEALSSEGTEAAYSVLRPWRAIVVWGFGPAFLSKFLYFVIWKMDAPGSKPLILDAQVAASIRLIAEPVYTRARIDQDMASWLWPTSNWWAHRYSQYIHLVHRVAVPQRPTESARRLGTRPL